MKPQILLTFDDSWSKEDLQDAAESWFADTLPGVVKAEVVDHCGGCTKEAKEK